MGGGLASAQGKQAAGTGGEQRAASTRAVVLGRVAPPRLGFAGRRAGKGQAVLCEGLPSLQPGHLHLFSYSGSTINTKVSSLCHGHAGNGGHRDDLRKPPAKTGRRPCPLEETTQCDGCNDGKVESGA